MVTSTNGRWWALTATALSLLVVGLDMTVLNVALPDIAADLDASTSQLQWFADAYLLVLAAVMLPAGMLGDRLGRKGLTVGALVVFGAGSLWCAYAGSPGALIAARCVLGLGAAVLVPLAMSAVVVMFEPHERARAVMVLSLATMVGLPLGPVVGGALLQSFWWGSVFLVNAPVVLVALVAVVTFLPRGGVAQEGGGFDAVGVVLAALGLVGLTYGVIEAPERGWTDPLTLGCAGGAVVVLAAFLVWERRLRETVPVFDFAVWAHPAFRWGAVTAAVGSLSMFGVMFTVPQYFRLVLGADALGTGLRTLPLVLGMLVAMQVSMRLGARVAPRVLAAAGSLVVAAGMALGATTGLDDGSVRAAVWTALVGVGTGATLFAAQNAALVSLPRHRAGAGSALVQTLRQVGSVLGIAVLGAALSSRYAGAGDSAAHFVEGMDLALWVSVGVALVAAVLAAARLPRTPHAAQAESEGVDLARAA
ncbi:MFS transporter [Nocardioides anomalus]|uniref:MFS transporter n=1 Tax=Nocardioides anomalus TaxID=2712223 RepID=A0A6G6WHF6_9ACTN|nr:MFS transporter [Nocardioides anomalus]QIG44583.1 MFS transporter [Nocardioides anomalus]